MPDKGLFISFEGIDGSGKSTQVKLLAQALEELGPVITREPGGSPGAEAIRELLLTGAPDRWSIHTELLLFNAARRDHMEKLILPALAAGRCVITDRFMDSTRVYQSEAGTDQRAMIDKLHEMVIGQLPDVTFIIDMDAKKALGRGLARDIAEDRFEQKGLAFQQRLREGFLQIAREEPQRCEVIDGDRSPEVVAGDILSKLRSRL